MTGIRMAVLANRALVALYAAGVAVLPFLIDQNVISATVGTDIGVVVSSFAAAWHGGQYVATRATTPQPSTLPHGVDALAMVRAMLAASMEPTTTTHPSQGQQPRDATAGD